MKKLLLLGLVLCGGCSEYIWSDLDQTVVESEKWPGGRNKYVVRDSSGSEFVLISTNLYKIGDKIILSKP